MSEREQYEINGKAGMLCYYLNQLFWTVKERELTHWYDGNVEPAWVLVGVTGPFPEGGQLFAVSTRSLDKAIETAKRYAYLPGVYFTLDKLFGLWQEEGIYFVKTDFDSKLQQRQGQQ